MAGMAERMLNLQALRDASMEHSPYSYAAIDGLFAAEHAARLAATYPDDHYRVVSGRQEKAYRYDARPFVAFGTSDVCFPDRLTTEWRQLGADLASPEYREAIGRLTAMDLSESPLEVNIFHYGPKSSLDPHLDLPDKLVTHVLYFNAQWQREDGGCLRILRSADPEDCVREVLPLVGSSAIIVRSDRSWHSVPAVRRQADVSRRSMTVTFYRPGSSSTLFSKAEHYRLVDVGPRGSNTAQRLRVVADRLHRRLAGPSNSND